MNVVLRIALARVIPAAADFLRVSLPDGHLANVRERGHADALIGRRGYKKRLKFA